MIDRDANQIDDRSVFEEIAATYTVNLVNQCSEAMITTETLTRIEFDIAHETLVE